MKDKIILFGWVAGLLLLISVLWIFSTPLQAHYLLKSVNNVLISKEDSRRLSEHLHIKHGREAPMGFWFSMVNSTDNMFVFTVFQNGILIPVGAIVSSDGAVKEVVPLSAHAVQVFDGMPKSILQMYIDRIEKGYRK